MNSRVSLLAHEKSMPAPGFKSLKLDVCTCRCLQYYRHKSTQYTTDKFNVSNHHLNITVTVSSVLCIVQGVMLNFLTLYSYRKLMRQVWLSHFIHEKIEALGN